MIMDWNENDDNAYILDIECEYPIEIHDEQSHYPLAPKNMKVEQKHCIKTPEGFLQTLS